MNAPGCEEMIAFDRFSKDARDFSQFLNAWCDLERRLKE